MPKKKPSYKDVQAAARQALNSYKVVDGYQYNGTTNDKGEFVQTPNRAARRRWARQFKVFAREGVWPLVGRVRENVQTFIKTKETKNEKENE